MSAALIDPDKLVSAAAKALEGERLADDELPPLEAYADEPGHKNELQANGRAAHPRGVAEPAWAPPAVVSYGESFNPAQIPERRWLLGRRRSVGELTIDSGPPGVNKSTLMLSDGVQIVTGRGILGDDVWETGGVLYLAGEDARRDVEARLAGILEYYHIPAAELKGDLHVVYLAEIDAAKYTLAQMMQDIAALNTNMLEWLRTYPDVIAVFLDPIAAWHRLLENSNEAQQLLCSSLRTLAVQGQRHVGFDHHVSKLSMVDCEAHVGNLAALRGAGSIGAAARWAFTMAKLRPETAATFGIPEKERKRYRRLDPLKASYGPDDDLTRLLRIESVRIGNGESVGVLLEVDMQRTRQEAQARKVTAEEESKQKLGAALAEMIGSCGPSSIRATSLWLRAHRPDLISGRGGNPLSDSSLRAKLPSLIGPGLAVVYANRSERIVIRTTEGKRGAEEIDFEPVPTTGQESGQ